MGLVARALYFGILACCTAIFVISLVAGVWAWAVAAAVIGALLAFTAPRILGRRWRPAEPKARTRAVSRRRR